MRERYIPAFIVLLAGAVTSIINIINQTDMITGLKRLLLVIFIFYFIGLTVKGLYKIALTKYGKKQVADAAEANPEKADQDKPAEQNPVEKNTESKTK